MKTLITILAFVLTFLPQAAMSQTTSFADCNLNGLEKIKDDAKRSRAFWNRVADKGKGNGGESVDILFDVATGDILITCVSTEDEDTAGVLSVDLGGGTIIPIGAVDFGEVDPGKQPVPVE